ncbi:membrane protein [Bryobacterales bacterium F-183]|nr:membrane protein [Bryobacterales bacterium F-183]
MRQSRKAFWWTQVRVWHWVSSAISLIGMILFAITGITLNHASAIEASPVVTKRDAVLPADLQKSLRAAEAQKADLPEPVANWLRSELGVVPKSVEWQSGEVYVGMPGPGSDTWLTVQLDSGAVHHESTSRGWVSYLNDLHKGRNTGTAWVWFLDVFAVASIIFCVTGLLLLQLHAKNRPFTWPAVSIGFVLPVMVIVIFIHR